MRRAAIKELQRMPPKGNATTAPPTPQKIQKWRLQIARKRCKAKKKPAWRQLEISNVTAHEERPERALLVAV
jgi:hypothetical protein